MTSYLKDGGAYEGFDVFAKSIKWCKKNIGRKYTNFNFQVSDIHNKFYNPKGKYKAAEYKFPYDNYSFDFVFLTSVFTHMRPEEMEHYMSEIARVLKKDGRCLITFFLLNQESLQLMNNGRSRESFTHHFDTYHAVDTEIPEYCIAYHEDFVLNLYKKYHLEILYPIHYGSWCGRDIFMGYQDIIIAVKD